MVSVPCLAGVVNVLSSHFGPSELSNKVGQADAGTSVIG